MSVHETVSRMTPALAGRDGTTRQRILDTAIAEVERDGLVVGLEQLGLERVIKASGVSRATAYRHWPSKADFLSDVLAAIVHRTRLEPETDAEVAAILGLLQERADRLATEEGRRTVLVESLRISAEGDYARVATSTQWRTVIALHATRNGLPEGAVREEVTEALAEVERSFTEHRAGVYGRLLGLVGYRLRAPLEGADGLWMLSDGQGALMTGLVVRAGTRPEGQVLRAAAFGSEVVADWSWPAYHLVHVLLSHVERDPEVVWDAARLAAMGARAEEMIRAVHDARGDDGAGLVPTRATRSTR